MDKKQFSRYKIVSTDSRRNSGVLPSKACLKNPHREISNHVPAEKETQRKKISTKRLNKRPKARTGPSEIGSNQYLPIASCGLTDLNCLEHNTIAPGRKSNLNHLLNFNYDRDSDRWGGYLTCKKNRLPVGGHKYNKEQFLQANFQFVVNWKAIPTIISSPDTLVDWEFIEQIIIQTTEELHCPICLYPPVAAKLTRCGHAFCWACILHYLALTDKTWRKCPICFEAIYTDDLKSMTIIRQKKNNVGDYIDLQLMRRMKGSVFVQQCGRSCSSEHLLSMGDEAARFSKFLLAENTDVISIINRETEELNNVNCDDNCPEFVFIQQALKLLNVRKSMKMNEVERDVSSLPRQLYTKQPNSNREKDEKINSTCDSSFRVEEQSVKYYYFYQSVDGQQIFLHPLNVKMLHACFGSLDRAPLHLHVRIVQKEHYSMDHENRKKFASLAHLPFTCHFEIVEVELKSPTVTEEIIHLFKDDVLQRKKDRLKKYREEKTREIRINEIFDKQIGKMIASTANIDLSSSYEFPMCGPEERALNQSSFTHNTHDFEHIGYAINRNTYSSVINSISSPEKELWPSLGVRKSLILKQPHLKESTEQLLPTSPGTSTKNTASYNNDLQVTNNIGTVSITDVDQNNKYGSKRESQSDNKKRRKNKNTLLFSTGMNFNVK